MTGDALGFFRFFKDELRGNFKKYLFIFLLLLFFYLIIIYKVDSLGASDKSDPLFFYSALVFLVVLSKYAVGSLHKTERWSRYEPLEWPTIDIIIPAYNEGKVIYDTVSSVFAADYPKDKINIVLINDGSKDDTISYINDAIRDFGSDSITKINFKKNRGKKEAMGEGIRRTKGEYVVFIDSDSVIVKNCLKEIIRPFYKSKNNIGAVCGQALPMNSNENLLTKMQHIRYYNSFRTTKGLESLLGFISCCPGCGSAYKRTALEPILKPWLNQHFLGSKCTFGDDRSLTNFILKQGYETVYNQKALVYTMVPETMKKYSRQQLRWKKSWIRESLIVQTIAWRKNPVVALLMFFESVLPVFAPLVIGLLLHRTITISQNYFFNYILWMFIFGGSIALYFKVQNIDEKNWLIPSLFGFLVNIMLIWQIPYALATSKDTRWGTR